MCLCLEEIENIVERNRNISKMIIDKIVDKTARLVWTIYNVFRDLRHVEVNMPLTLPLIYVSDEKNIVEVRNVTVLVKNISIKTYSYETIINIEYSGKIGVSASCATIYANTIEIRLKECFHSEDAYDSEGEDKFKLCIKKNALYKSLFPTCTFVHYLFLLLLTVNNCSKIIESLEKTMNKRINSIDKIIEMINDSSIRETRIEALLRELG